MGVVTITTPTVRYWGKAPHYRVGSGEMFSILYVCMSRTSSVKGREQAGLGFAPTMLCIVPSLEIVLNREIHLVLKPTSSIENRESPLAIQVYLS